MDDTPARPYVSVVVTAYRRRTYLRAAVASALDQTLPRSQFEVVVVKDFADAPLDGWLASEGVRTVTGDLPRQGQMLAAGIRLARGEVVSFLDDDDRFHRDKLAGVAAAFRADPRLGLLRNAYEAIGPQEEPVPSWSRYRPQPESTLTIDTAEDTSRYLPWISRNSVYANVSTMSLRRSVLLPWLDLLDSINAGPDLFLSTTAALSRTRHRFERERWNDYRVHSSMSHASIAAGEEPREIVDLTRQGSTAALLLPRIGRSRPERLAYRMAASFLWETEVSLYLLQTNAHLRARSWVGYLRAAGWRRQRYMLREWAYCPYRAIAPTSATRRYRARRSQDLRRSSVGA